jgi:hypothetical protein
MCYIKMKNVNQICMRLKLKSSYRKPYYIMYKISLEFSSTATNITKTIFIEISIR